MIFSSILTSLFLTLNVNANSGADSSFAHNRERQQGIEAYKAQKALEEAEAERARRNYVEAQKGKLTRDRERRPEFRKWQSDREIRRNQQELIRRNQARRMKPGTRDRDSQVVVPQSERIDHNNRALYNASKSLIPSSPGGSSNSSSGYNSGFSGNSDFSPPPPPPPPSYGNTFAPPAPDIYEPDPNSVAPFDPQMGDEIPPPIFDEADF